MLWRYNTTVGENVARGEEAPLEQQMESDAAPGCWEMVWSASSRTGPIGCHWAVLSGDGTSIIAMDGLGTQKIAIYRLQLNTLEWSIIWEGQSDDSPSVIREPLLRHLLMVDLSAETLTIFTSGRDDVNGWNRNTQITVWKASLLAPSQKFDLVFEGFLPYFGLCTFSHFVFEFIYLLRHIIIPGDPVSWQVNGRSG